MYSNTFDTSNRYVKYRILAVETYSDITNNRTKVRVTVEAWRTNTGYTTDGAGTCYVNINGVNYSNTWKYNDGHALTYNSYTVLFSWEDWIYHNPDGTKSVYIASYIEHAVFNSNSNGYSVKLTDIPRQANITAAPDFNDEENPTIQYSNPAGNVVTSLQAAIVADYQDANGDVFFAQYRDVPINGTSYTFELTEEERSRLRYATINLSTPLKVRFYLKTVLNGEIYYSIQEKEMTVINADPEITCTAYDVGTASLALTGNKDILIKGFNYVEAAMSSVCKKGATIKNQTITNGSAQLVGETGGNHSMKGGMNNVESGVFVYSLTDSRGKTVTATISKQIVDYIKLTCNLVAQKPTVDGDLTFTVSGNYFNDTFGAQHNYLAVEYRYKEVNGEWTDWHLIEDGYSIQKKTYSVEYTITGLDYRKAYTVQTRAQDRCLLIESAERTVKAIPVYDWGENDFAFNVPVSFEGKSLIDLIYPVGAIYISSINVNPETLFGGKWAKLEDVFLLGASANYPEGSTGGEASHTLTVDEMPSHKHEIYQHVNGYNFAVVTGYGDAGGSKIAMGANGGVSNLDPSSGDYAKGLVNANYAGGNQPHNNMPPYLAVHMWKRYE